MAAEVLVRLISACSHFLLRHLGPLFTSTSPKSGISTQTLRPVIYQLTKKRWNFTKSGISTHYILARDPFCCASPSLSLDQNGGAGDRVCLCLLSPPLNHGGPQPSAGRGQCVREAQALPRNLSCLAGARCECTHPARPRAACFLAHRPAHTRN